VFQELDWRLVAEGRMLLLPVVEDFDVFEADDLHVGVRRIANAMHPLVLEAVEPAFRRSIVPAISFAAHGADPAVVLKLVLKGMAGIRAAPVGVRHQACGRSLAELGHGQRIRGDVRRHVRLQRPATDRGGPVCQGLRTRNA